MQGVVLETQLMVCGACVALWCRFCGLSRSSAMRYFQLWRPFVVCATVCVLLLAHTPASNGGCPTTQMLVEGD